MWPSFWTTDMFQAEKIRELENNSFENCAAPLHEQWQILDIIVADNYVLHLHTCRIFLKVGGNISFLLQTMKSKIYRTLHLTIAHYCMNNGRYYMLLQQISTVWSINDVQPKASGNLLQIAGIFCRKLPTTGFWQVSGCTSVTDYTVQADPHSSQIFLKYGVIFFLATIKSKKSTNFQKVIVFFRLM